MTRFLYLCSEIVKHKDMTIELFLRLLGSLALLIYGMKTMSDALRKKIGPYAQNIVSRTGFGYVFED